MKTYLLLYCAYCAPSDYHGHFTHRFSAPDFDTAQQQAKNFLASRCYGGQIEWQLNEVATSGSYELFTKEPAQ